MSNAEIVFSIGVHRNTVAAKYIAAGVDYALNDSARSGRPNGICDGEEAWLTNIVCTKLKDIEYAEELWTYRSLPPKYKETLHRRRLPRAFPNITEYCKDDFGKR